MTGQRNNIKKFTFGVMLNSLRPEHWQKLIIKKLLDAGLELKIIILNDNSSLPDSFFQRLRNYPYSKFLFRVYNRFLLKPTSKKRTSIQDIISGVKILKCKTTEKKYTDYFNEKDIDYIKSKAPDFILRFGFNILRGDILNVSKHGIWSYHHDDEQKYRGGPPGFWEIYKDDHVNGIILQKLTEKLDAGIILKKGYYRTIMHSYSAHIDQIYYESTSWPLQLVKSLQADNLLPYMSKTDAKIYHEPSNHKMLRFWIKLWSNKLRFHFKELFSNEDWNIAVANCNPVSFIFSGQTNVQLIWLPKQSRKIFAADPFIFSHEDTCFVLYENYDYGQRKGHISIAQYKPGGQKFDRPKTAIEEEFHLSYPFVFEFQGTTYCIPESFEKRQIRLYSFDPGQQKFNFEKVILDDVDAIDSTMLYHENRWWLFFTRKDHPSVKLYAYYADDPLGEFIPHRNNPVKVDVTSTRPAGSFFVHNNELYRPAQDNAETYGKRIVVNRVQKISPDDFEEEFASEIKPIKNSKFGKGIHTVNFINNFVVIDGKGFVFLWKNFLYQLSKKIRKLFGYTCTKLKKI